MRFSTRVVAAAATLPFALGVAACGGGDSENTASTGHMPSAPASAPASTTSTAPPKAARLNRVTFLPAMKAALEKQKNWRMSAKMTANGKPFMTMSGVQQADPLAISVTMSGPALGGGKGHIIALGKKLYLSMPNVAPAGKYLAIDLNDPSAAQFGSLANDADPTKTFKAFDKSLRNAKFVKTETIGGRKLDRYAVTVDTAAILKAQGKQVPAGLPKTLTYNIWMDSAHVIRRMTFSMAGIAMVMTMDDFNQPVSIKAPAASKIVTR